MFISRITIENFRNFKNAAIEFSEGVNVIIGHNNAGKTTLLKALGLIFDSSSSGKLDVDDFSNTIDTARYFELDPETEGLKEQTPPKITISVIIKESTGENPSNERNPDDKNTVYDWLVKIEPPYEAQLTYTFFLPEGEETTEYQRTVRNLINANKTSASHYWDLIRRKFIQKYIVRLYGGVFDRRERIEPGLLKRFDFQYLDALRDAERHLFTGRSTLLKDVLNYFLDDDIKNDNTITEEQRLEQIEAKGSQFFEHAKALIDSVKSRINERPILEYSREVGASLGGEPTFEGEISEVELFSSLRLIVKNALGVTLPVTHNGLGYNNLIYISVLLAKMQMSASNYGSQDDRKVFPMLLIEEPEAHLHPSMQFKLLKFLKQNFKERKQVRQVFVTTHSTHITAAVDLDEIICLNIGEDNLLNISYPGRLFDPASPEEIKSKAYVKRFLDATKSDMLFAKRVIFVEGIAEQLLMSCLANYQGLSLEDNHISVVNVNGRYFHHFLRLFDHNGEDDRKKYALNKRVVCITDADPTRKRRVPRAQNNKCWPYELGLDGETYDYSPLSTHLTELINLYGDHNNIKICSRSDEKGKTFEYDLMFINPKCKILLVDGVPKKEELERLIDAYDMGLDEILTISTTTEINDAIRESNWLEDDDKKNALIASRYLMSIEAKKGEIALNLEYVLRENLSKDHPDDFCVPEHIKEALTYVCD